MKDRKENKEKKHFGRSFLKDVFISSLGAYGGPETHLSVLMDQLAVKKKYLTEQEMIELAALCNFLPGPTSTQIVISAGYKLGGPSLGARAMVIWALPALVVMGGLSFVYSWLTGMNLADDFLRFIGPMAVGFVLMAGYRVGRKVITGGTTAALFLFGIAVTVFLRTSWGFPLAMILGGGIAVLASRETGLWHKVKTRPPWIFFVIFMVLALFALISGLFWENRILYIFDTFYRYGYLVFGGGQVVVPLMYNDLVQTQGFLTSQEFLAGYGLVQGLPGPMFSFCSYAGGMAARDLGTFGQILGAAAGGIGVFLPGMLLIFFVYPVWENLKSIKGIRVALTGINGVAGGMIAGMAIVLIQSSGITAANGLMTLATLLILASKRIPAPLIVVLAILAGIFMPF